MNPDLKALCIEACALEGCPSGLRDAVVGYLSGAAARIPSPSYMESLWMDACWYLVWTGLSGAGNSFSEGSGIYLAHRHLALIKANQTIT